MAGRTLFRHVKERSPNKLLARLPADEYRHLLPHLETVALCAKRVLLRPNVPVPKVYFPGGGVCSLTTVTTEGDMAGVALVGNEGLVGLGAVGSDVEGAGMAIVEIADGDAQAMDVRIFRRAMEQTPAFKDLIHRYAQAFLETLMQSVACNALHSVERRCARCLLDLRARTGGHEIPVTQAVLATMLGVRRESIALAISSLHRAGLVETRHKRIGILDPAGLERASCECHTIVRRQFARLFP
jgi:CRP-like cAMP-binding protein